MSITAFCIEGRYAEPCSFEPLGQIKGTALIAIKPAVFPEEVKRTIKKALHRGAQVDAEKISVGANGSTVILRGTVRSLLERVEAERAA